MNTVAQHLPTTGTTLYAQPYSLDAAGFYFHDLEEFDTKAEALRDRFGNPVEEFELQYIEGDDAALFDACGINQANLEAWFISVEGLEEHEKAALFYLCDCNGYELENALDSLDDVCLYQGELLDAATELFDECYLPEVPKAVRNYIDYEAFARDCRLGGDMAEFRLDGTTWTVTNAAGV